MPEKLAKESCSRVSPRATLEYVVEIRGIRGSSRPPIGRQSATIAMVNKAHVQLLAEERKTVPGRFGSGERAGQTGPPD